MTNFVTVLELHLSPFSDPQLPGLNKIHYFFSPTTSSTAKQMKIPHFHPTWHSPKLTALTAVGSHTPCFHRSFLCSCQCKHSFEYHRFLKTDLSELPRFALQSASSRVGPLNYTAMPLSLPGPMHQGSGWDDPDPLVSLQRRASLLRHKA